MASPAVAQRSPSVARRRYSFGNLEEVLDLPDLIAIQRESFDWFLNKGLAEVFADISPIKDYSENLLLEFEFDPGDEFLLMEPKFSVEECKEKDMTYSAPVFVRARFLNRHTGEIKEQVVFMGHNTPTRIVMGMRISVCRKSVAVTAQLPPISE